jgi:predicted nucleic acid-binding protein
LADVAERSLLAVNPVIYAEVSVGFEGIEELEEALLPSLFQRLAIPWEAAFLAGKAFLRCRRQGGRARSPLPDFFIGAHALVGSMPLLTRDAARQRTYYPQLELIVPEG